MAKVEGMFCVNILRLKVRVRYRDIVSVKVRVGGIVRVRVGSIVRVDTL